MKLSNLGEKHVFNLDSLINVDPSSFFIDCTLLEVFKSVCVNILTKHNIPNLQREKIKIFLLTCLLWYQSIHSTEGQTIFWEKKIILFSFCFEVREATHIQDETQVFITSLEAVNSSFELLELLESWHSNHWQILVSGKALIQTIKQIDIQQIEMWILHFAKLIEHVYH